MSKYTYHEHIGYSPISDCDMARVSIADSRGGEFFALIPVRRWSRRRDRQAALDAIVDAIESGVHPGEVRVILDDGARRREAA